MVRGIRSERSEGGYAAKAGNVGAGANYDSQTGKVNKPNRTAPPGGSFGGAMARNVLTIAPSYTQSAVHVRFTGSPSANG